jgi:hypothetical protein
MEYVNINESITVNNLPLFINPPLILKNVNTLDGIRNVNLKEVINLIEFTLREIIDLLIKKQLNNCVDINYYVLGGKGLNTIIQDKYLLKSFDFDIHVKNEEEIKKISKYLVSKCKEELDRSWQKMIRNQIYKKLLSLNIVDNTIENYYMFDDLIFYGIRKNRLNLNYNIKGLFLKLKLKNNIFSYNNVDINYTNYYRNNDLVDSGVNYNILYIPIADIDIEENVNFGFKIYNKNKDYIYINPGENIMYANYVILLFNLLKSLATVPNKLESNLYKYNKIIEPLLYKCNLYSYYNYNYYNYDFFKKKLGKLKTLDTNIYNDSSRELQEMIDSHQILNIDKNTTYINIIEKIVNRLLNINPTSIINKCRNTLGPNIYLQNNNIFKSHITQNEKYNMLNESDHILYDLDKKDSKYYIIQYTDDLYKNLNVYCNYVCNNIQITNMDPYKYENKNLSYKNILGNINISINVETMDYNDIILVINNIIDNYNNNQQVIQNKNKLLDVFYTYSLQVVTNFSQMDNLFNRSLIDLSYIKPGDVIEINQYLSTTFNNQIDFYNFDLNSPTNSIFYKIEINKNNKRWMFINKYSRYSIENEILIKQGSIFIIKSIDYETVYFTNYSKEYKIITMELCDDLDIDEVVEKKILEINGFKPLDNILKSALFIKSAKYVYDTYFSKPYSESDCIHMGLEKELPVQINYLNGNIENKIIYRYNHSLAHAIRVACWIQLLYLQDIYYYDNSYISHEFLMKTCIASLFMISGRESEVGFSTGDIDEDIKRDCEKIQPDPYNRYLEASANNFQKYINEIKLNLFSYEDIEDYMYCLRYYYYIYNELEQNIPEKILNPINNDNDERKKKRKICASYFNISHGIDLIRCHSEMTIIEKTIIPVDKNNPMYEYEKEILRTLAIDIIKNTGDRIFISKLSYSEDGTSYRVNQTNYDYNQFYLCSTNVEYCINNVLNTTNLYFNNIVNVIKKKEYNSQIGNYYYLRINQLEDVEENIDNTIDDTIEYKIVDTNEDEKEDKIENTKNIKNKDKVEYKTAKEENIKNTKDNVESKTAKHTLKKLSTTQNKNENMEIKPAHVQYNDKNNIKPRLVNNVNKQDRIKDDEHADLDIIQMRVNNNNIGSTFYLSTSKYYDSLNKNNKNNNKNNKNNNKNNKNKKIYSGIYFQNTYINLSIFNDNCNNKLIIYNDTTIPEYVKIYEKELYPQYFISNIINTSNIDYLDKNINRIKNNIIKKIDKNEIWRILYRN